MGRDRPRISAHWAVHLPIPCRETSRWTTSSSGRWPKASRLVAGSSRRPGQAVYVFGLSLGQLHRPQYVRAGGPNGIGTRESVVSFSVNDGAESELLDYQGADDTGHVGGYLLSQHPKHQGLEQGGGVGWVQSVKPLHQSGHHRVRRGQRVEWLQVLGGAQQPFHLSGRPPDVVVPKALSLQPKFQLGSVYRPHRPGGSEHQLVAEIQQPAVGAALHGVEAIAALERGRKLEIVGRNGTYCRSRPVHQGPAGLAAWVGLEPARGGDSSTVYSAPVGWRMLRMVWTERTSHGPE